jgi:hypothetical protein
MTAIRSRVLVAFKSLNVKQAFSNEGKKSGSAAVPVQLKAVQAQD